MASQHRRLPSNVPGDFFVDETCIDCDTCRWMAPETFDSAGEYSRVYRQPETPVEVERALQALIACPTGSIGTLKKHDFDTAREAFPLRVADDVYHCGWHAEASFGATSYLIARPDERGGNVLVDSPRFNRTLVRRLEELGGVRTLFLTHRDDVADHERFAAHFACRRVAHADDAPRGTELKVEGLGPVALDPEIRLIPVPGHTRGSMCLLYRDEFLFSGDHVAWSETRPCVRLPERLLVRLVRADPFDGAACPRALRMDPARTWLALPFRKGRDGGADAALHQLDEEALISQVAGRL